MRSITKTVFKVGDFVAWAKSGQLDLRPDFQRRPVWKSGAKSYLIDTVVRGLPVPIVFLRDRLQVGSITTKREVVDGQQRLRTILGYIDSELVPDYDETDIFKITKIHNSDLAGKGFRDLTEGQQLAIIGYEIPVHVFSADTEDRDVLQIFARLNATGVKLNDQELRNAEYFGAFKSLSYTLAYENLNRWIEWNVFGSGEISRMLEVEEVSDLVISMEEGVHAKNKKTLNKFYRDHDAQYSNATAVQKRFDAVMSALDSTLGEDLKETEFSRRALFNDLFVATYHLMYGIGSELRSSQRAAKLPANFAARIRKLSQRLRTGDVPEAIAKSLRGATADYGARLKRVNFVLKPFGHELTE